MVFSMKASWIFAGLVAASCGVPAQAANLGLVSLDRYDSGIQAELSQPAPWLSNISRCDAGLACDGAVGDGTCSGSEPGLLGFGVVRRSETCYDDFISPMTNPVYFEDPRQLSELRGIFIDHKLPVLLGAPAGEIRLYALQARVRLTDRWSLIAVKDGYIESESPLIQDGWADVTAGLKYSLYRDASCGRLLSAGLRYETYAGHRGSLQGNGNGVFDLFLSGGTRLGNRSHYLTSGGLILPVDSHAENQMAYWSHHLDYRILKRTYLFSELNWYNYIRDANAFPVALEGGDLFNFGSPGVSGNNIVTNAYGLKFKPTRHLETGVALEFPLTERRGILDNRITADLILRY
jgi:hypothetical protein